ncbi:unnamed protein product, partial [Rangifer tarandus platyrhynchus]
KGSNQSVLKEINPDYSLEGLMLKLKLQSFGHLIGMGWGGGWEGGSGWGTHVHLWLIHVNVWQKPPQY